MTEYEILKHHVRSARTREFDIELAAKNWVMFAKCAGKRTVAYAKTPWGTFMVFEW